METSFICQKCQQPLNIERLDHVVREAMDQRLDRSEPVFKADDGSVYPKAAIDRTIPRKPLEPAGTAPEDEHAVRYTMAAQRLFDRLSEKTSFDHPLCQVCADLLLDELDERRRQVEAQAAKYSQALAKLQVAPAEALTALEKNLKELEAEEAALTQKAQQLSAEREAVQGKLKVAQEEAAFLDDQEQRHWLEYNEYHRQLADFLDFQCGIEAQYQHASEELERLKKTNVLNDAFHIWYEGHFGTINSLRLGRLPSQPVEWTEINAAWGQVALLLHTISALQTDFRPERFRIVPFGSFSRMETVDEAPVRELPLHHASSFKIQVFGENRFDSAMIAFLDYLEQFTAYIESRDPHFKLPYRIEKDRIGDSQGMFSIRSQQGSDESWTRALKLMCVCVKWSLAWVCRQTA